jgi:archaellum component FlaC
MTYVLIALVASSFIFEYWLLTKINNLNKENKMLQKALEALGRDTNNFQAGATRDSHSQRKELLIEAKRINKKVDVMRRDIINSLPTQIRKVIGHIEFAKPLDNNHGRG